MKPGFTSTFKTAFSLDLSATWRLSAADKPLVMPEPIDQSWYTHAVRIHFGPVLMLLAHGKSDTTGGMAQPKTAVAFA